MDSIIKEFAQFLHEEGCLAEFISNIDEYCYVEDSIPSLIDMFNWHDTLEGHHYWSNLYDEWQAYCKENDLC